MEGVRQELGLFLTCVQGRFNGRCASGARFVLNLYSGAI